MTVIIKNGRLSPHRTAASFGSPERKERLHNSTTGQKIQVVTYIANYCDITARINLLTDCKASFRYEDGKISIDIWTNKKPFTESPFMTLVIWDTEQIAEHERFRKKLMNALDASIKSTEKERKLHDVRNKLWEE